MKYTFEPGIACILHVMEGDVKWTVIYMAPGKLEAYRESNMKTDVVDELFFPALNACKSWFDKVFAVPVSKRGEYIRDHAKDLPTIEVI